MSIKTGVDSSVPNESGDYNVKQSLKQRARVRKIERLTKSGSPIPAQIKDAGEYARFFNLYKDVFIPYAGTENYTSQGLLNFLLSLSQLSPTKCSVIRSQYQFALSGKIQIVRAMDTDFDVEQDPEDVSEQEKRDFVGFVRQVEIIGIDGHPISFREYARIRHEYITACGNFYVLVSRFESLGVRKIQFRIIEPNECLYVVTPEGEPRIIGVSKYWTHDYITRNPVSLYPAYPEFIEEDGVERSIIHEKTNGTWYGRPEDMGSMLYQFLEYQNVDYLNTETKSRFTGQVFIEVEEAENASLIDDEESQSNGFDSFADEIQENFSNKSDEPLTVMITSRPYKAGPAQVVQFRPGSKIFRKVQPNPFSVF